MIQFLSPIVDVIRGRTSHSNLLRSSCVLLQVLCRNHHGQLCWCRQLLKQIRGRWGKMCVLEWEAQQHERKVQNMEAEISEHKAKNMLWEQKYKALKNERADAGNSSDTSSSSSDAEEKGTARGNLQEDNDKLRKVIFELKQIFEVKPIRKARTLMKHLLLQPTDAMKIQDPAEAGEIKHMITKIKDDERNLGHLEQKMAKLKSKGQLDDPHLRDSEKKRFNKAEVQKLVYEKRIDELCSAYARQFSDLRDAKGETVKRHRVEQQHLDTLHLCKQRREDDSEKESAKAGACWGALRLLLCFIY